MKIKYPAIVNNEFKKYYFCYRLQQRLQEIHNIRGQKYRNKEITLTKWKEFQSMWYEPRIQVTLSEIKRIRKLAKNFKWNIDLNNIFIEE